jgi:hypothetical protein
MGLDSVELVIAFEEAFGISISDEAAASLRTPRDVTDLVMERVATRPADECLRQQTLFRLRRGFRLACTPFAAPFALDTRLRAIFDRRAWPRAWATIRREDHGRGWPERAPFDGAVGFRRRTVMDLVNELALRDARAVREAGEPWTRELVALHVRRLVRKQVGAEFFADDDEFVNDLGID